MAGLERPPAGQGDPEQGDLTHAQVQEWLERHTEQGIPLPQAVQAHLNTCPECRAYLELLRDLELALLEGVPATLPPPELRAQVLEAARAAGAGAAPAAPTPAPATPDTPDTPARRWWPAALGALGAAAVVSGLLVLGALLTPSRSVASALPDPAVVVSVDGALVVASNDPLGTISVIRGSRVVASLDSGARQPSWFTEGVRLGERVYLADAGNDRVLEVQAQPLRLLKTYPVPGGIAGLTASTDSTGGRVYFKGVRGEVGELGGRQITIAHEAGMPLADVMDGVLLSGGKLFVTHHLSGEVCLLNPETLAVLKRVRVGGMPVALDYVRGGVLVLDVTGRLLHLSAAGAVERVWAVGGHPDKLSVNADVAVLTDRGGTVTRVNLTSGQVSQTKLTHPMDVARVPGGQFAVAEGGRGLRLLDGQLNTVTTLERRAEP